VGFFLSLFIDLENEAEIVLGNDNGILTEYTALYHRK
jgi:hypothetical protein